MSQPPPRPLTRRLLDGWLAIAARFGAVQTQLLLAFLYVTLIGPVSIVQWLARQDQLDKRRLREAGSAWQTAASAAPDLERAKLLT